MSTPTGDKRSVATDALETLGMKIDASQKRDAIHLAVEPVVAGHTLYPGQEIGLFEGKATTSTLNKLGIVDPFLKEPVQAGEMFWLIVYPRQIHSLRHVWTHPAFPDEPALADLKKSPEIAPKHSVAYNTAKAFLDDFIKEYGCSPHRDSGYPDSFSTPEELVEYIKEYEGQEYMTIFGSDAYGSIPLELWTSLEIVTGYKPISPPASFSCSC